LGGINVNVTLETRPARSPRIVYRTIDGEAVLVDAQHGKVRVLNEVAGRMWELIDGQRSLAEIAAIVSQEYEAQLDQVESDVVVFLDDLMRKGLCS
jgi:hypothetical protein